MEAVPRGVAWCAWQCAEAGARQGAAFDVSEEAAEKMMENIAELETRGFTLDRPTSLPAEAVPQQDRHMSSRGMRGRCAPLPAVRWQTLSRWVLCCSRTAT